VPRRPSQQTVAVLAALASDPARWRYGYELGKEVGLKAGSLYPILMRLGDRGGLESTWESDPPQGRPPRHLYRLTAAGARAAADAAPAPARRAGIARPQSAT
jgi:PadR family transcriptional regulator, regulatory protein PadR